MNIEHKYHIICQYAIYLLYVQVEVKLLRYLIIKLQYDLLSAG